MKASLQKIPFLAATQTGVFCKTSKVCCFNSPKNFFLKRTCLSWHFIWELLFVKKFYSTFFSTKISQSENSNLDLLSNVFEVDSQNSVFWEMRCLSNREFFSSFLFLSSVKTGIRKIFYSLKIRDKSKINKKRKNIFQSNFDK